MSESHDILSDIIADRAGSTTDPVRNLRDGSTFTAEIDGSPDAFTIQSELGEDIREAVLLHVADPAEAAAIRRGDVVQFTLFGQLTRHTIVKRRNNAANPQAEFWAAKIVEGIDT